VTGAYPTVWRFCAALAGSEAADDLAQETFLRATRALPTLRGQASRTGWILSIARHTCMDDLRGRYRRQLRDAQLPQATPVADASAAVSARDLLHDLEPDRRAAFVLTQLFGLTYEETAGICECAVGTIRSRVARAREDLIVMIEDPARGAAAARRS
jgi:RNA polymerase sigma-70 factor (ECF subfamily)